MTWRQSGTYRLVVLRLCRGGGRCRHGRWSDCSRLDRGERVPGQSRTVLSHGGTRLRSVGLNWSRLLLSQSATEAITQLLHGDLEGGEKIQEHLELLHVTAQNWTPKPLFILPR